MWQFVCWTSTTWRPKTWWKNMFETNMTDRQADRQTYRHTDRHTGRQTDRQTDRHTGRQTYRQTHRQTDRRGSPSGTSEVVQDALRLSEGRLALLCRLLSQSFSSIGSSQQLICRLSNRKWSHGFNYFQWATYSRLPLPGQRTVNFFDVSSQLSIQTESRGNSRLKSSALSTCEAHS